MKILHILYQSLPQISGSSIRSRDLLMAQKEIGLEVVAITSPFQTSVQKYEVINGIKYYRTRVNKNDTISDKSKPLLVRLTRMLLLFSFYNHIKKVINEHNPDVLHAHAMFFCGLPALILSKKYNIPIVYEFRSLWMLKKEKKSKGYFNKFIEKQLFKIELYVMKRADCVIAINDNLREVLINSGIDKHKVKVVYNAVNTTLINHLKQDIKNVRTDRNLNFGYIGTLTPHEGIDLLIHAFSQYNLEFPHSRLYIYGNGIDEVRIKALSTINSNIYFKGSIEPNRVNEAFNSIDIIVNPRYKNKLTDSVTPLKPLEAMAYEKLFIGSDVGGIKELVTDKLNGFLFTAGDFNKLRLLLCYVSSLDFTELNRIKKEALNYVTTEKSWLSNSMLYNKIYQNLLNE